jgi:hypothetical protein
MSDELVGRSNSLLAELLSVVLDVDDDDRDIIRVIIAITNESAVPISKIESSIDTIGKGSYAAERSVSSIGPGLTRNFHFTLGEEPGHWVFNLSHGSDPSKETLEIGPIRADLRIGETLEEEVELAGASIGGGVGGGMIADVFSEALDNFGKVRETIEIQMEFEGTPETSSRDVENKDELAQDTPKTSPSPLKPPSKKDSKSWDEVPKTPPPKPSMTPPPKPPMESSPPSSPPPTDKSSDPLLSPDILAKISSSSSGMTSKSEENARPPPPTQGNKVHEAPPTSAARIAPPINAHSESSPSVREAPPTGPPSSAPPSSPSSGPPSGPPSSAPPSSPSSGPPSGPPSSAPPSSPSSGPPSGPPASVPPSGPPANIPPSGPPSGPPASAPPKSAFKPPSANSSSTSFKPPTSGPPS